MLDQIQISERRACALVGLSRDSYRKPPQMDAATQALAADIAQVAHERRRWGYRLIGDYLRPKHGANHKRIWRLYKAQGLQVRRRRKKKSGGQRVPLVKANAPNQTWSMDFIMDALDSGRRLKSLVVSDDFTRECVQLHADFGMGAHYVCRLRDDAARFRGYPKKPSAATTARSSPLGRCSSGATSMASNTS
jgi:putative transposase